MQDARQNGPDYTVPVHFLAFQREVAGTVQASKAEPYRGRNCIINLSQVSRGAVAATGVQSTSTVCVFDDVPLCVYVCIYNKLIS